MVEFRFEKLDAWQLAIELSDSVYRITRAYPADERSGLTSQLRRAATSVPANIAEGSGRISDRDNLRFLEMAYGSLMEVVSHLEVATRQDFVEPDDREALRAHADRVARVLSGLCAHLSGKIPI